MSSDKPVGLLGGLEVLPFTGASVDSAIRRHFLDIQEENPEGELLVMGRSPADVTVAQDALLEGGDPLRPTEHQSLSFRTVTEHAQSTLNQSLTEQDEIESSQYTVLGAEKLFALLTAFGDTYDWETEYLAEASKKDSFYQDLSAFVAEALTEPEPIESTDPILADLSAFAESFHQFLLDNGHIARHAVRREALQRLEQGGDADKPDGILVVGFEELIEIDRRYLARISQGATLRCLSRADSSVFRTWRETGRIAENTDLQVDDKTNETQQVKRKPPAAVAHYLATGETVEQGRFGQVVRLHEETVTEQLRAIGTEIESYQKHQVENQYNDVAVVFRDPLSPIADAVELLWNMGIPVSRVSASGLEHDPAARELYAVANHFKAEENGQEYDPQYQELLLERLTETIVSDPEATIRETLDAAPRADFTSALAEWTSQTQLKSRIAEELDPMQAKLTFSHIETVFELAAFFDGKYNKLFDTSWETFTTVLEHEFQRAESSYLASDVETEETGVTVDTAGTLRGRSYDVVFVAGVVEGEYPSEPGLNRLVPEYRAPDVPAYPAVTTPSMEDFETTFSTPTEGTTSPYRAYNQAHDRRLLATAAALAEDELFFCTYAEEQNTTGKRVQPSRYLSMITENVDDVDMGEEPFDHRAPEQIALDTFDETINATRRRGELPADDQQFAAIRRVLDAQEDRELSEAFASRIDWYRNDVGTPTRISSDQGNNNE